MEENYWDNVSDNYLVERIRLNDCEKSLNELIKRHSPLCFKILKKYSDPRKIFFTNFPKIKMFNGPKSTFFLKKNWEGASPGKDF